MKICKLDSKNIHYLWEYLFIPFNETIFQLIQQQETQISSTNQNTDILKNMVILIIISRFLIDSLGFPSENYSKWFLTWIQEKIQNIKMQKQIMNILISILPYDSAFYISIHIKYALPPSKSKTMRKYVSLYVQQGTKRLHHLGYLLNDTDTIENTFFTKKKYLKKNLIHIMLF